MRASTSAKSYEIKATAGKGLGVFAVRDVKCGTRIMCEQPLIHVKQENLMDVPAELAKLSPDDQALFLSLHCRPLDDRDARDAMRTNDFRTQQNPRPGTAALSVEELVKTMAIYESNSFEVG